MLSAILDWLSDKSSVAIVVATASAAFTGGTLIYTRRLALNDTKKMKRKAPVVEVEIFSRPSAPAGWKCCEITIQNLEQVSARLLKVRSKRRSGELVFTKDTKVPGNDEFAPPVQLETIHGHRELEVDKKLTPAIGTPRPRGRSGDIALYLLYCRGIRASNDIELVWEWADGQKK